VEGLGYSSNDPELRHGLSQAASELNKARIAVCALVMIGARPNGEKELLAVEDGYR
jgi:hypothetical protein